MIFSNRLYASRNRDMLEEKILKCLDFARENNMGQMENGSYPVDGDKVYVNIASYETMPAEERKWEAHKKYVDIHYVLDGTEQIDLNFIDSMEQGVYVEPDDFLPLEGEKNASVVMGPGDYLVCFPEDGHKPGVMTDKPCHIKKGIFKVKIG